MQKIKYNKNFNIYILLVVIIFLIVYLPIVISGKMYIYLDIGADTYCSYWPVMAYMKRLLEGFKLWDMSLGFGASNITYFSFLADPFNWIIFLFDYNHLDIGIFLSLILKNICVAIFSYKYIGMKKITGNAQIVSSLMITFSGWFVGWGQHYHFATFYAVFIILLYFFECWMQYGKYVGLVLAVMLLALISTYISYMIILFMVIYYFFSLYYKQKSEKMSVKDMIMHSLKTASIFLLGLACSAILFLPNACDILNSPRVGGKMLPSFTLGGFQEYMTIFLRSLSNSLGGINVNFCGFRNFYESPFLFIGIIGVFLLSTYIIGGANRKKYFPITIGIIAVYSFVNLFCPIFNAFSTKSYRWTFVFVPILAVGCGMALQTFDQMNKNKLFLLEGIILLVLLNIYIVWYNNSYGLNQVVIVSYFLVCTLIIAYMIVLSFFSKNKLFYKFILFLIVVDLAGNAYITVNMRNLLSRSDLPNVNYFDGTNDAVEYLESVDNSFYRISKNYNSIDLNDNMFQGYNGEKLYSSILSAETWNMQEVFDLRIPYSNYLYGFEDKQILRNITAGKYRFTKVAAPYYGYQFVATVNGIHIYQNYNCANWGTVYNNYCLKSDVTGMNQEELQNVLLYSCIIDDSDMDNILKSKITYKTNYETIQKDLINEQININRQECLIELNQDNEDPLILMIEGVDLRGEIEIFQDDSNGIVDRIVCDVDSDAKIYYIDNMYINRINIHGTDGIIKSYKLYKLNGEEIISRMIELNKNHLEIISFSDMNIKGTVDCETPSLLFIPIAYNSNWNVSVNGENAKIYRADAGFMAVVVPKGKSNVEITYKSNIFVLGGIISVISITILFFLIVSRKLHERNTNSSYDTIVTNIDE